MKTQVKHTALALFGIALMGMISCKKDDLKHDPIGTTPLLEKIIREGSETPAEAYEYNSNGQLIKMREEHRPTAAITFTYSGGKPDKAEVKYDFETNIHYTYRFMYGADGLDKLYMYYTGANPNNANPQVIFKYSYQNNKVNHVVLYNEAIAADKISSRRFNEYYPNGDLKSVTVESRNEDGSFSYYYSIDYEYDTRLNPMNSKADNMASFIRNNAHNITKETYREGENHRITEVKTISYTYLRDTYPLTATEVITFPNDPDEPAKNSKYTYQYKQ